MDEAKSKLKQCSIKDFCHSPLRQLQRYNVQSSGWMCTKPSSSSSSSSKFKTKHSSRKTKKSRNNLSGSPRCNAPISNMKSPLQTWLEKKDHNEHKQSWKHLQELSVELSTNGTVPLKDENKNRKKKKRLLLTKSESFEKYGVILPSADAILRNIDTVKKQNEALQSYDRLCQNDDTNSFKGLMEVNLSSESNSDCKLLDCKHVSLKQLKRYFEKNLGYLENIFNEVVYSKRHHKFKDHLQRSQLVYNTSTVVFSDEQREYLLKLLEKKMDQDHSKTEYLFKVLLPEICLKIFMEVHEMTESEANEYLDWRPVE